MPDKILFLGDSFTWGEGLELFIENGKWIKQRELHSEWPQLEVIQDIDSLQFRDNNRYPSLVGSELGILPVMELNNGGCFSSNVRFAKSINISNVKCIFVQLSQIHRNTLHLSYDCWCTFCAKTEWTSLGDIYRNILENNENDDVRYILDSFGHSKIDNEFLRKFLLFIDWHNRYLTEMFIEECKQWEQTTPVYFIDSWSMDDSNYWRTYSYINNRLINLIKKDNTTTKSWDDFIKSFKYPYIINLYPNTANSHPTPELHGYLAKSVISHLKENLGY